MNEITLFPHQTSRSLAWCLWSTVEGRTPGYKQLKLIGKKKKENSVVVSYQIPVEVRFEVRQTVKLIKMMFSQPSLDQSVYRSFGSFFSYLVSLILNVPLIPVTHTNIFIQCFFSSSVNGLMSEWEATAKQERMKLNQWEEHFICPRPSRHRRAVCEEKLTQNVKKAEL